MPEPLPENVVFLPFDQFYVERVFPIRNIVGDQERDSNDSDESPTLTTSRAGHATPTKHSASVYGDGDGSTGDFPYLAHPYAPYAPSPPDDAIRPLSAQRPETTGTSLNDGVAEVRQVTERIHLVPTTAGSADAPPLVSINDGLNATDGVFYRCEDEPIHTPGAIQQCGALLALRYDSLGNLEVRIASENAITILRRTTENLFRLASFLDIVEQAARDDLEVRIANALQSIDGSADTNLDIFPTSITSLNGDSMAFWCALHVAHGTKDLLLCEFEPQSNDFYLDGIRSNKPIPKEPTHIVDNDVSQEEQLKSTTSASLPLRALQIARRKQHQGVSSMDLFNSLTQAQQQLASAKSTQGVLDTVVGLISELTGFHRVMCYRFDGNNNGCVEAELVDPKASSDFFRGMHFPASDIPVQARQLYKVNRIRILYDRDEETARLVCRDTTDFEKKLDLTHSYLRAMSPVHLTYLKNMGVRGSMSVSIVIDDELWGLIACHEYGDHGIRVTLPIRELCRNIGECAANHIQRQLMLHRLQARKPPVTIQPTRNPSTFIAASSLDLLQIFGADFGLLSIQDEARAIGRLDPYREALAILAHLQQRRYTRVVDSQNINKDFPDIRYAPGINIIAGLLVVPLSMGGSDFLVFFRKGQLDKIRWAGNPYEKVNKPGSQFLEPRSSFKRWTEIVVGTSKEWSEDQLDMASILSLLYGRFIEIWRQKEAASQNNRMTRLLIRNAAHEVRTPLNAIVNYLEIALENKIDDNIREILNKAHKASRSLIYVIDDLLNLTKAAGDGTVYSSPKETFDLGATVSEVIGAFHKEAIRKGLNLTVSTHQGIPEMVKGDSARLRQILSNITSNAFQHSIAGGIKVDIKLVKTKETSSVIAISVQDDGAGMSERQLDDLFLEFEQILDEDAASSRPDTPLSDDSNQQPLGIGLAVVARYVRNMNGQIRVRSELGKGTIFGVELPFEHVPSTPKGGSLVDAPGASPPSGPIPRSLSSTSISSAQTWTRKSKEFESPPAIDEILTMKHQVTYTNDEVQTEDINSPASPVDGSGTAFPFPSTEGRAAWLEPLRVLIAEDNPINARLLTRRLQKVGHKVEVSADGQECHDQFTANPAAVDVILMDLQMPLVDGSGSTSMIRKYERGLVVESGKSPRRVPVIAVSASLTEENRFDYLQSGFDGWIHKPIDFNRLDLLLRGVRERNLKGDALYTPGKWEIGGWFLL